MTILEKLIRGMRSSGTDKGAQGFYGRIARKNPNGGPSYEESRRDYEQVRAGADFLGLF